MFIVLISFKLLFFRILASSLYVFLFFYSSFSFFIIFMFFFFFFFFFFSSRRRHTRLTCDWSSDVCSSDLDGDVLVVTSKIVSKAEGRLVEVPADGPERDVARAEALAGETARVVARRGPTTIVQTHHGFVMAAGGIDASNVDKTHLVLLPADPDASARRIRDGFLARGLDVAVVVSDTMGRAWRNGLTDVALGAAGISPFRDHRGETDP